jgi:hypothetical protein
MKKLFATTALLLVAVLVYAQEPARWERGLDMVRGNLTVSTGNIVVGTGEVRFGATNTANFLGGGTTAAPLTLASGNAVGFWTSSTNTSDDVRTAYLRNYFSGSGGSGETLRAYSTINGVSVATGGTVNGAHISLNATGASAAVSGSAQAARFTFDIASNVTALGGTTSVVRLDSNIASGPTFGATTPFISVDNLGAQKLDYLLRATNSSTTMFANASGTSAGQCAQTGGVIFAKVLKISVDGTDYWIGLCTAP